jgi:uncharacterized protein (DUF433 family)
MEFREPIEYIELRKTQFGVKPVISGRSVKIENIGVLYENESDIDWIAENLELTHAQVHAALAYFYDNREAFEEKIQEGIELAERIGTPLDVFLNSKDVPGEKKTG